jgi:hypothetical protein
MNLSVVIAAALLATLLAVAANAEGPAPAGWLLAGSTPASYEVGTAPQGGQFRGPAGFLRSKDTPAGFGTLMQMIRAEDYRGKRVRFSATVRTEALASWAGLWMRVDGKQGDGRAKTLAFDNMMARPIKGTTDWQPHEVVLDVPEEAAALAYGVLINGAGAAYLDNVRLEVVSAAVPATAPPQAAELPRAPQNLQFTR